MALRLKFNPSEPGFWVSARRARRRARRRDADAVDRRGIPDAQEGIPVEIITDNQFSQITKGEKTAKEVLPTPKPRADRVAEKIEQRDPGDDKRDAPAPPKRPEEMKVAEKEEARRRANRRPPPPPQGPPRSRSTREPRTSRS